MEELEKFNFKINVIPNTLEKYIKLFNINISLPLLIASKFSVPNWIVQLKL